MMKNIVIIEDDIPIQDVFKLALDKNRYTILCYNSGEAFLEQPPASAAMIIVDKNMPGISGLHLCAQLKAMDSYREVPIVMMSADPYIAAEAKAVGANDVLAKPFKLAALRTIVARYAN
jgi:CheY-like chemotaxis protein